MILIALAVQLQHCCRSTDCSVSSVHQQKQLQLGDKMDLWSYLLKPVQRISKYSLLLQDMMRECGPGQTREMAEVKAALEVIHYQLRHGNNLLAMDAIHNCDVRQLVSFNCCLFVMKLYNNIV